jgi:DMSO reductase family type II enzyme chaperone
MFVYSLAGLKMDGEASADVEVEDSPISARLGVYQQLARLFAAPDQDSYDAALAGEWPGRLASDAKLLPYPFDYGAAQVSSAISKADFEAEYLRLFEVGPGVGGPPVPLFGGCYGGGDRMKKLEDVVRFYEYFGLHASAEDPRPPDHLATEFEFMKFLTYKEAASPSPRLQASFRRAQLDFAEKEVGRWLPEVAAAVTGASPMPFWDWAAHTAAAFVSADIVHMHTAQA